MAAFLDVRVVPNASRSEVVGWKEGVLRVRLQAPPVDGKANAALIAFLADVLRVHQRQIALVLGESSRKKRLRIDNLTSEELRKSLRW